MGTKGMIERLRKKVEEGEYYDAQQIYKTLSFRYFTNKRPQEAIDILTTGALTMLSHAQITCATELSRLILNIYNEDHTTVTQDSLEPIIQIVSAYPAGDQEKISLLKAAIKWSSNEGENKQGHPTLYALLAGSYSEAGDYATAQNYYIKSNSTHEFAQVLAKWMSTGYPGEHDLFIARAVLQYVPLSSRMDFSFAYQANLLISGRFDFLPLLREKQLSFVVSKSRLNSDLHIRHRQRLIGLKLDHLELTLTNRYLTISNLRDANVIFSETVQSIKLNNTPLLNYIRFLLLTLERNAYPLFELLRKKYSPSLARDPSFSQYLDHIADVFYKVKPQGGSGNSGDGGVFGNFFSDMLRNLLAPPNTDESDANDLD